MFYFNFLLVLSLWSNLRPLNSKREKQICWQAMCHFLSGDSPGKDTAVLVHSAVLICYMSAHYFPRTWITLDSIIKCHVFTCYGAKLLLQVPPGIYTQPWWGRRMMAKDGTRIKFSMGKHDCLWLFRSLICSTVFVTEPVKAGDVRQMKVAVSWTMWTGEGSRGIG